ncbi:MAG: discoidin domain-containing protein, partial [Planctomycetota bacterium]
MLMASADDMPKSDGCRWIVIAAVVVLALSSRPCQAADDVWNLFSAELRKARGHVAADRLRYDELGPLRLRLTTPQAGAQLLMRGTPPPQPPWFQLDLGDVRAFDRVALVPAIIGVAEDEFEPYAFPPQFRVDASDSEDFATFQLLYDSSVANADPKSPFPLVIDTSGLRARYLRITLTELANVAGRWTGALSEIVVLSGGRNLALNASVTSP